jgi:hypothetical protein
VPSSVPDLLVPVVITLAEDELSRWDAWSSVWEVVSKPAPEPSPIYIVDDSLLDLGMSLITAEKYP